MTSTALVPISQGIPTLEWRVVLMGTTFTDKVYVCTQDIMRGVSPGSIFDVHAWTSEDIYFWDCDRDTQLEPHLDDYAYWLLVRVSDIWMIVKQLDAASEPLNHGLDYTGSGEEADGYGQFDDSYDEEEEEPVSTSTVMARARFLLGNTEQAREAASLYPGDFI